jgi:hypothetical protein
MQFTINVDMNKWLRGTALNKAKIIEARKRLAYAIALNIEENAKSNIDALGINDTGVLREGIISYPTSTGARVKVQARYAWFIEFGTGIHNKFGNGRKTPWVYKHRDGSFRLTLGRKATPFLEPAVMQTQLMSSRILEATLMADPHWRR